MGNVPTKVLFKARTIKYAGKAISALKIVVGGTSKQEEITGFTTKSRVHTVSATKSREIRRQNTELVKIIFWLEWTTAGVLRHTVIEKVFPNHGCTLSVLTLLSILYRYAGRTQSSWGSYNYYSENNFCSAPYSDRKSTHSHGCTLSFYDFCGWVWG